MCFACVYVFYLKHKQAPSYLCIGTFLSMHRHLPVYAQAPSCLCIGTFLFMHRHLPIYAQAPSYFANLVFRVSLYEMVNMPQFVILLFLNIWILSDFFVLRTDMKFFVICIFSDSQEMKTYTLGEKNYLSAGIP